MMSLLPYDAFAASLLALIAYGVIQKAWPILEGIALTSLLRLRFLWVQHRRQRAQMRIESSLKKVEFLASAKLLLWHKQPFGWDRDRRNVWFDAMDELAASGLSYIEYPELDVKIDLTSHHMSVSWGNRELPIPRTRSYSSYSRGYTSSDTRDDLAAIDEKLK